MISSKGQEISKGNFLGCPHKTNEKKFPIPALALKIGRLNKKKTWKKSKIRSRFVQKRSKSLKKEIKVLKRNKSPKGQIISKRLFGILGFFQKTNEQIRF